MIIFSQKNKNFTAIRTVLVFLLIIAIAVLICYHQTVPSMEPVFEVQDYRVNDGPWQAFDKFRPDIPKSAASVAVRGFFREDIAADADIFLLLRNSRLLVRNNGRTIYQTVTKNGQDSGDLLFCSNWISLHSPGYSGNDLITLELTGPAAANSMYQLLQNMYIGQGLDLLRLKLQDNIWQLIISLFIGALGMTLIVTLFALRGIWKNISRGFFSCGMLLLCGSVCTLIDYDYISLIFPNTAVINQLDYLSQALICIFMLSYLRFFFQTPWMRKIVVYFVALISFALLFYYFLHVAGLCTMTTYITLVLPPVALMVLLTAIFLFREYYRHHSLSLKILLQSGTLLALFTIAEMVHFYLTSVYWIVLFQYGLLIFAAMQLFILIRESREKLALAERTERAERMLAENRVSIMLSQIQPHFLYNALTAISRLCEKNPFLAKQATIDFAQYLRGNLDSLKQKKPVPFSKELEHVRAYLSLEKMHFGDGLRITCDISTADFTLPALTVQPLIENAIKHGISKSENGGSITLSTREYIDHYEIIISDNGAGFDPEKIKNDGHTHIGIENVRNRLWSISQGTLAICSKAGVGTTAVIRLPKSGKRHMDP